MTTTTAHRLRELSELIEAQATTLRTMLHTVALGSEVAAKADQLRANLEELQRLLYSPTEL